MVRNRSTNKDYSCYDMAPMEGEAGIWLATYKLLMVLFLIS